MRENLSHDGSKPLYAADHQSESCKKASYKHLFDGKADIRRAEREANRDTSEKNRRYYLAHGEQIRQRAKEAEKKKSAPEPAEKKPAEKINTEQCKECIYWRYLRYHGHGGDKACHYLLDNEKRRKHNGNKCYSRTVKPKKKKKEWPEYV